MNKYLIALVVSMSAVGTTQIFYTGVTLIRWMTPDPPAPAAQVAPAEPEYSPEVIEEVRKLEQFQRELERDYPAQPGDPTYIGPESQ